MRLQALCLLFLIAFSWGCTDKDFDANDPAKSYATAKQPYDNENYEMALTKLGEFKARFPYSKYATEAELLLANSQFELGHYTESALAYEQFVKLHPRHPKIDFAMFRVGESYWEDAPEEVDREQDYTQRAVTQWEKLVAKLPDSSYAKKASGLILEGKRRIADSNMFIVNFYCKQEIYHACAYRAIQLADHYAEFPDLRIQALNMAVLALNKVADAKAKDPKSDKNLYLKSMSADEIRARAENFRKLIADYKKSVAKDK